MQIEHAIEISGLVCSKYQTKSNNINLASIEELFTEAGLEEGSFGIFKITYADNCSEVYFDYPTDMNAEQAHIFAEDVFVKTNDKPEIDLASAIDISDIVLEILKTPLRQVSLTHLRTLFVNGGLEENQFKLSMTMYVDGRTTIGFIYPSGKNTDQIHTLAKTILIKSTEENNRG